MKNLSTIVKKDLKGYFDQPTGYILIVIFYKPRVFHSNQIHNH